MAGAGEKVSLCGAGVEVVLVSPLTSVVISDGSGLDSATTGSVGVIGSWKGFVDGSERVAGCSASGFIDGSDMVGTALMEIETQHCF